LIIVSLRKEHGVASDAVRLDFSDGTSLLAAIDYLPEELNLKTENFESDLEIDFSEEEAFRNAALCYKAEKTALKLIARAEQYSLGLTSKLEQRGFDASTAMTVVNNLSDKNLLNDLRYAELWINAHSRGRKPLSPWRLTVSLRRKGIDADTAGRAIKNSIDPETEYKMLLGFIEEEQESKKEYLRSYLKKEGFSISTINRYFDE